MNTRRGFIKKIGGMLLATPLLALAAKKKVIEPDHYACGPDNEAITVYRNELPDHTHDYGLHPHDPVRRKAITHSGKLPEAYGK